MAVAYATVVQKWLARDPAAFEMGRADSSDQESDELAW
jgi:hypothetical protein